MVDEDVTAQYAKLVANAEVRNRLLLQILTEYRRSRSMLEVLYAGPLGGTPSQDSKKVLSCGATGCVVYIGNSLTCYLSGVD
jgi:hypothetical protein